MSLFASADAATTVNTAAVAEARAVEMWTERHESFAARSKKGGVEVIFLGDSITQGWEGGGKAAWKEHIEPLKAANFGIGGARTQHVLWRITEGQGRGGIRPQGAGIMHGTNHVAGDPAPQTAAGAG